MKNILNILLSATFLCLLSCNGSADIEIPALTPGIGEGTGSEIVFTPEQLKLPSKKGACFTLKSDNYIANMSRVAALNVGWNYSWGSGLAANQPESIEFVPMIWGGFKPTYVTTSVLPLVLEGKFKRLLGFNEPDGASQANMTVEKAIELWPTLEKLGIPLGSPAVVDAENGTWIESFMAEAESRGYRVDYLCVHNYGGGSASEFKRKIEAIHNKYKRPILITEFAVADWTAKTVADNKHSAAKVLSFMKEVLPWLEETEYVYGYAWFSFNSDAPQGCSSALFDKNGDLTELGKYYSSFGGAAPTPDPDPDPDPSEGTNLVLNPGFEEDPPIWTGNAKSNVNFDKASASEFNASCVITGNGTMRFAGVSAAAYSDQTITVEKGKTYSFGFTGRIQDKVGPAGTDLTHDYAVVMTVRKKVDGKWVNLADPLKITVNNNTKVKGTVTIGDDCPDTINILFSKAKGIAYIDDVFFIEVK